MAVFLPEKLGMECQVWSAGYSDVDTGSKMMYMVPIKLFMRPQVKINIQWILNEASETCQNHFHFEMC